MSLNKKNIKMLTEELKKGYKEMAELNLEIAQEAVEADNECLEKYEKKLTECEQ